MEEVKFIEFPKMPRLSREMIITEKIDGTNACIHIDDYGNMLYGSRTKWINVKEDNYGFAKWCEDNKGELLKLGPGLHFGEWWGNGIQRGYDMKEKVFSLFNVSRWIDDLRPKCCRVVPILYRGLFNAEVANKILIDLEITGSIAAPGFMRPEGIIIWHVSGNFGFKKTLYKDELPKSLTK